MYQVPVKLFRLGFLGSILRLLTKLLTLLKFRLLTISTECGSLSMLPNKGFPINHFALTLATRVYPNSRPSAQAALRRRIRPLDSPTYSEVLVFQNVTSVATLTKRPRVVNSVTRLVSSVQEQLLGALLVARRVFRTSIRANV